jgi:hypothetical protein
MAKIMKCRSVGLDCDFVARGETEAQVMEKVPRGFSRGLFSRGFKNPAAKAGGE